jgi:integrase
MRAKNVSHSTLQNIYGFILSMFSVALDYDFIKKNPVRTKIHRPESRKVEKPTLKAEQIRAILENLTDEHERLFALLLAVTGMRIGEALALRWIDFDAGSYELSINHTLFRLKLKKPKTERSKDKVKLDLRLTSLLSAHRNQSSFQGDEDFIFCRPDGRPLNPSQLRKHLYKVMDVLKIKRIKGKFGHHIFRHSAGTLLYAKSRDLKLVQETLRHADISTTSDIYVHLDDKVLGEGTLILTDEILGNCARIVPVSTEMVS